MNVLNTVSVQPDSVTAWFLYVFIREARKSRKVSQNWGRYMPMQSSKASFAVAQMLHGSFWRSARNDYGVPL